jgi:hypothetical protein
MPIGGTQAEREILRGLIARPGKGKDRSALPLRHLRLADQTGEGCLCPTLWREVIFLMA